MTALWQDIRYGIRMLAKNPGFGTIAIITLAIGIGANTIMFSAVNALALRPVQVRDLDRVASCSLHDGWCSYTAYVDLRDNNTAFTDLAALGGDFTTVTLVRGNVTRRVSATFVSANYFSTLGAIPARGRTFGREEERQGAEPVAVLSYRTWQRQGADPNMVGEQVAISGTFFRVVGVAPKGFTGTSIMGPDLWLPLGTRGLVGHAGKEKPARMEADLWDYPMLSFVGRLKPGLDMIAAHAQLQRVIPRLRENYPRQWREKTTVHLYRPSRILNDYDENETAKLATVSAFLMSISTVVLLIACLNLANMIVVQGTARHREIAIRMALGGGRLRIIRQLLFEFLLLALLGGAFGLILAFWGTRMLSVWIAVPHIEIDLAGALRMGLDMRVLSATLGFCLIATVLFGLKPALRLSSRDIIGDIKEFRGEVPQSIRRRRHLLPRGLSVVAQIALSVLLVVGAVLFTRSALHAARLNPGFSLENKLLIQIDPLAAGYDRTRSIQVHGTLADRLRSMPGVQAVALSTSFPFGGGGELGQSIEEYVLGTEDKEGEAQGGYGRKPGYVAHSVGPDFFESMGIPLSQGRPFGRLDSAADAEKVVIIDERLARKLRPNGSALGCLIRYGWRAFSDMSDPYRVVGIVPDARGGTEDQADFPQIYVPLGPDQLPTYIHVRIAAGESEPAMLDRVVSMIRMTDPGLPIVSVTTLVDNRRTNPTVWAATLGARLAIGFGAMALFLASLGIYAVKGYMVASRTPEIGIRKALGATHWSVMGMVLREGMVLTISGLIVGLFLVFAAGRLIANLLYGVSPADPVSIAVAMVVLGVASLLAAYVPARRAAKVDPMVALRYE